MSVSIIIPCYNNRPFVGEAISSALSQTGDAVEVIVVDDGSTDGSAAVVRDFPGVVLLSQPNKGVSAARNNGVKASSGEYLLFLDADDRLRPGAVEAHVKALNDDMRRVFVFGVCDIIDEQGALLKSHRQDPGVCDYWDILLGITPNPSQCMLRKAEFDKIGGFNEALAFGEDWECFLRMSRTGKTFCHGAVVADYRKHQTQSTRKPSLILSNMLKILDDHCRQYANGQADEERFARARVHYTRLFGKWIPGEIIRHLQHGRYPSAVRSASVFFSNLPASAHGLYAFLQEYRQRRYVSAR